MHEDVVSLDVSVNEAFRVEVGEAFNYLLKDTG